MSRAANLAMLEIIAAALAKVDEKFVFVGGATTALYVGEDVGPNVRPTDDVDCIVELTSTQNLYKLDKKLRASGFTNSHKGPLCRMTYQGIAVDIMPADSNILGFSNKWYSAAVKYATPAKLPNGKSINTLSVPFFFATKIEAYKHRGQNDFRTSHDMEDIVTVLDGGINILDRLQNGPATIQKYLKAEFKNFLENRLFIESLEAHLSAPNTAKDRAKKIEEFLKLFIK